MAKNWAICIGINYYVNMPDLTCANWDAKRMQEWFVDKAGFDNDQVFLFTDDANRIDFRPTGNILKRFFRVRFKPNTLSVEDNLWFFFSGHGLLHEGKDYLMPSDGDPHPEGIEETAISLSYVTERLRGCGAGDVIIIYDACRDKLRAKGLGMGIEQQKGVITLASCSRNEKSYEIDDPSIKQGSFTYALLEALENTRLGQGNYATFDRLYQRLKYRVPEINRQYGKPEKQHPYGFVEPDEKRYSILLPQQATTQDIETYKKQALNAELNDNLHEAERLLIRLWEICPGDPEVRQYYNRVIVKKHQQPPLTKEAVSHSESSGGKFAEVELSSKVQQSLGKELQQWEFKTPTVNRRGEIITNTTYTAYYFTETLYEVRSQKSEVRSGFDKVILEMVAIPGGTFTMGSPENEGNDREKPQHNVTVPPFFMGKYPITQAQWKAIASRTDLKVEIDLNFKPSYFTGDNRPVERVNWYEAVEFCQRLSKLTRRDYRLPSEAEWEYACRGRQKAKGKGQKDNLPFYFGETITADLANYDASYTYADESKGEYRKQTTPVGQFPPNAFGLYDLHGNVWEWCADDWHDNYEGAPTYGSAWNDNNKKQNLNSENNSESSKNNQNNPYSVLRGGSWYSHPNSCRSAIRYNGFAREDRNDDDGFRVVCVFGRNL